MHARLCGGSAIAAGLVRLPIHVGTSTVMPVLLLLGGLAFPVHAEEVAPPPVVLSAPVAPAVPAMTVVSVVSLVQRRHPTAQALAAARQAAAARVDQAGYWANPELEFNAGRTRPRTADLEVDRPYGVKISQRLSWWQARSARVRAATAQAAVAHAESAARLLELEVEVRLSVIAWASAQASVALAKQQTEVTTALSDAVVIRQALGDIDNGEVARIRLEAAMVQVKRVAAERQVALQMALLQVWCGEDLPAGFVISDALLDPVAQPVGTDHDVVVGHPRLRAAVAAERAAEARVTAERQARIPDLTVGIFGDREREKDSFGLSLGLEVPLWDRNAAGIAEAEAERAQRAAERAGVIQALAQERTLVTGELASAAAEVLALRDQVVPVANDLITLRMAAFSAGGASVAEVLESRRAALSAQGDLLAARRRYAELQVRLLALGDSAPHVGEQP